MQVHAGVAGRHFGKTMGGGHDQLLGIVEVLVSHLDEKAATVADLQYGGRGSFDGRFVTHKSQTPLSLCNWWCWTVPSQIISGYSVSGIHKLGKRNRPAILLAQPF